MLKKYEGFIYEDIIISEYVYLSGRGITGGSDYYVPHIGEIIDETWKTLSEEEEAQAVQEAIDSGSHIEYGLSKKEFSTLARTGKIPGFKVNFTKGEKIQSAVIQLLRERYMSYQNYDGTIINSPIGKGIW